MSRYYEDMTEEQARRGLGRRNHPRSGDRYDQDGRGDRFGPGDRHRGRYDHRGRGPKAYVRSDARIEDDVHVRLTNDGYVDAREITVSVKDREITLDGTVDLRQAKRRAKDCADSVSGVVHVQNNLHVQTAV
tara:strand:+ start:115 stop:510 length:396 start_codon:yes stop_codon:yes gene_type:complete